MSYHNPKYPWIEALHYFHNYGARPREWDAARITMPAKRGPGEYLVEMRWAGYKDIIDVDVLSEPAVDIYGSMAPEYRWNKVDHCQYVTHGGPIRAAGRRLTHNQRCRGRGLPVARVAEGVGPS